jgi:hypothetical protein
MRSHMLVPLALLSCALAWAQGDSCSPYSHNLGPFPTYTPNGTDHVSGNHTFVNYMSGSCGYTGDAGPCDAVAKAKSQSIMEESGTITGAPLFVHETATADQGGLASATSPQIASASAEGGGAVTKCASCSFTMALSAPGGTFTFSQTPRWSTKQNYTNTCPEHSVPVNSCGTTKGTPGVPPPINPCGPSPILIDTKGQGFHFTNPKEADGYVTFRFGGQLKKVSWPDWRYENGWLVLADKNGVVDDADDLFGNYTAHSNADYTPFKNTTDPNGWLALAFYTQPSQGGNGSGVIDKRDAIWPKLRVWIPKHCHEKPNEPCVALDSELFKLDELGIHSISTVYTAVDQVDAIGNQCRFVALLNPDKGERQKSHDNKVACDFFLAVRK